MTADAATSEVWGEAEITALFLHTVISLLMILRSAYIHIISAWQRPMAIYRMRRIPLSAPP
jgi:hypothetical protein